MDRNDLPLQTEGLTIRERSKMDVSPAERTMEVVCDEARELHASVAQIESMRRRAGILFGPKSIDLPMLIQQVNILSLCGNVKPLEASEENGLQGTLKWKNDSILVSIIDEVNRNLRDEASRRKWECMKRRDAWAQEETCLLHECSGSLSHLNRVELGYASAVHEYNDDLLAVGCRPNLVQKFARMAESFNDDRVNDMWAMLVYMVDVTPTGDNVDPIRMRMETPGFMQQAKRYLEHSFGVHMSCIVHSPRPVSERADGASKCYNLVGAYVAAQFNETHMVGLEEYVRGKPLWPLVYYAMRSGDLEAAQMFLSEADTDYKDFIEILKGRVNRPEEAIVPKLEAQLKLQYAKRVKKSKDPYKKMVYVIILGCDVLEDCEEVVRTIEDFLWVELSLLCAQVQRKHKTRQISCTRLQMLLSEGYGENHFNVSKQPDTYFQVLVLTGQFEAAIEFLARQDFCHAHAVHMALALNELRLLGTPHCLLQPLLSVDVSDPRPLRRLNLVTLLLDYVKRFENTYVGVALQYYYFLRGYVGSAGSNLFINSVCNLALGTGAYELIFGKLVPTGNRQLSGGLLLAFDRTKFTLCATAAMVAENLVQRGNWEHAVLLFNIAGQHSRALKYLCLLLSQVVHQHNKPASVRARLAFVAANYNARLLTHKIHVDSQLVATFHLLYELLSFFDFYYADQRNEALQVLARTKLVPKSIQQVDECIARFKRLSTEMYKVMPDVMFAAMDILYAQYKKLLSSDGRNTHDNPRKNAEMQQLCERAKALHRLASKESNRMPGEACNRLLQIEVLMLYMTIPTRK